jgi:hypothetical protein
MDRVSEDLFDLELWLVFGNIWGKINGEVFHKPPFNLSRK